MKIKKSLLYLITFTMLLAVMNAQTLPSVTEQTQKEFSKPLWTDTEVQDLVKELNTLSEDYIKEAYSSGWNAGYKEGYNNGKTFTLEHLPLKCKAKYFCYGLCTGFCTGSTTGLLLQLRL